MWIRSVLDGVVLIEISDRAHATLLVAVKGKLATLGATRPWTASPLRDRAKYGSKGGAWTHEASPKAPLGGAPASVILRS